jgi:hypothetical protein
VLGAALDDEGRARLRIAATAAAEPKMRIAIEAAAAAEDDDTVVQALARLPPPRAR